MLPSSSPSQHHNQNQLPASTSTSGGPFYLDITSTSKYQLACGGSDICDAAAFAGVSSYSSSAAADAAVVLPRTLLHSSGVGCMPAVSREALFTAAQWQELHRQTEICKYIMASVPVPPQLLVYSYNNNPSHPLGIAPVSQSTTSALDLRFSSGTSPQPWRCRRTDGKKWRCSRDVAPGQKYCERHAHKSRPRSRKPVEIQSHNATNYCTQPPFTLLSNTSTQLLQKPFAHFPVMSSVASYGLTRGTEWFTKGVGGSTPVSTYNQQRQQLMQSSSRAEVNINSSKHNEEECSFSHSYDNQQDPLGTAERSENHQLNGLYWNLFPDPKAAAPSLQGNLNTRTTQTTRHFIDAWWSAEKQGLDKISQKSSLSSSMKLPPSSLTLSIPGGDDIDEDNEHGNVGFRMMNTEQHRCEEVIKSHWMNPDTWMGSTTPGGPLGEALCLGLAGSAKSASNLPSPHGYSNSTTTTSSCSRSSCEDGSHDLNFIG